MPLNYEENGGAVLETVKPRIKPPRRYQVVLLNDDFTPMEFVVEVLIQFFAMDEAKASAVMLAVHHEGKGICGVYSREVAETKVQQVNHYAREHQHPLQCQMEIV